MLLALSAEHVINVLPFILPSPCSKHHFNIQYVRSVFTCNTLSVKLLIVAGASMDLAGSIPAGVNGFFIDIKSFRSHYDPGVDSAPNRNEYQEYFLLEKLAGA